jgi:hypothetical protein
VATMKRHSAAIPKIIRRSLGSFSRKKGANRVDHIAGIEYGVDYGLVAVFLVWIVLTVALVILLELRSPTQKLPAVVLPQVSPTSRTCVLQDDDSGWPSEQRHSPSNRNIAELDGAVEPTSRAVKIRGSGGSGRTRH